MEAIQNKRRIRSGRRLRHADPLRGRNLRGRNGRYHLIIEGTADTSKIAASDEASESIPVTAAGANDVNATGVVDIADARAVYNCANKPVSLTDYYEVYIRADVNSDRKVDTLDIAEIINALKTAAEVDSANG